jgi:pimeloyl-ACP methyl ester carboxylesterase
MSERKTQLEIVIADKPAHVSVREWRVPKAKWQVICFHGFGVNGSDYAPMAERLNRMNYDVIAPDWIGHGDSDYLGDPNAYSWDGYARCLSGVLRRYHNATSHYVGTSWGGAVLLLFLLSRQVAARPIEMQSAVFVDVPLKSTDTLAGHSGVFETQKNMTFPTIEAANEFLRKQRPAYANVPERFRGYFDRERFAAKEGVISFKFDPAILAGFASVASFRFDRIAALSRIRQEALFLYGQESPYRSLPDFMNVCAKMPNIHYRDDLPGAHPPMLFQKEQFEPVIDFIKRSTRA